MACHRPTICGISTRNTLFIESPSPKSCHTLTDQEVKARNIVLIFSWMSFVSSDLLNGAQEKCELPPLEGFPHCEGKLKVSHIITDDLCK